MSQVLKALQKSQKQYEQVQPARIPKVTQAQTETDSISNWLLIGAVGVLIGASLKFYVPSIGQPVDQLSYRIVNSFMDAPAIILPMKDTADQAVLDIQFFDKPQPQNLAALPKLELPKPIRKRTEHNTAHPQQKVVSAKDGADDGQWNLSKLDLSGLSPELANQVSSILKDSPDVLESDSKSGSQRSNQVPSQSSNLVDIEKNSAKYHGRLPALNLQTHMYASSSNHRWVKINGKELQEGQSAGAGVKLVEIAPRYIVVSFAGDKIKIPALYEWKG
ncbi:general secretion pathway protein GspB [Vibrio gallicus]|uniref:general secretion pathway protein GspB n=1 Tax=Vibrio gallicus TaxID=190897 RepID=UPI0021C45A57|nr:general secretion pathway protein GspB [Vibrio gallicus]